MFTRRGKYVVRKGSTVIGSATTLLDAADVAMEDARKGPGKYAIEQPVIEVDVSKAYGVIAQAGVVLIQPQNVTITDVQANSVSVACDAVSGAASYQWYLDGSPSGAPTSQVTTIAGLQGDTAYSLTVAAISTAGVPGNLSLAVSFTTLANDAPEWVVAPPAQSWSVGTAVSYDLRQLVEDQTSYTLVFSLASGTLPAGVTLSGSSLTGTPTAVYSGALTFTVIHQEHPSQHTSDSLPMAITVAAAPDTTAPPVPTGFDAVGYSTDQVKVSWTQPSGDTVVSGAITSGLSHVEVHKDGTLLAEVLNTAVPNNEYIAPAASSVEWKVRSVDFAGNRSAFATPATVGPLVAGDSSPDQFAVTRTASTQARLTWRAPTSGSPTAYRVYMSLSEGGTYSQVYQGLPTPASGVYSYTHISGFSSAQEPWFYVTAIAGATESVATQKLKASIGTYTAVSDTTTLWPKTGGVPDISSYFGGISATATDAFGSQDYNANPSAVGGDLGMAMVKLAVMGDEWAARAQLSFHNYGTNSPSDGVASQKYYPGATRWATKGDASGDDKAHRNEFSMGSASGLTGIYPGVEHWFGFLVYLPSDTRAMPAIPGWYSYGPQLHPTNVPSFGCSVASVSSASVVTISSPAVQTANYYSDTVNASLRMDSGPAAGQSRSIVGYTAGRQVTVSPAFSVAPGAGNSCTVVIQGFNPAINMSHGTGGYGGYGTTYGTNHPAGAPVVRYKRADTPLGAPVAAINLGAKTFGSTAILGTINPTNDTKTLYVEWDAVAGASTYRVEFAWRPEGPWTAISAPGNASEFVTVDLTNRRVVVCGLCTYTSATTASLTTINNYEAEGSTSLGCRYVRIVPIISGSDGTPSLICPGPNWHWTVSGAGISIDARPDYGRAVPFVLRYKVSETNQGLIQVFKDGASVGFASGIKLGDNEAQAHYWKMGIYHARPGYKGDNQYPLIPMHYPWRRTVSYGQIRVGTRTGGPTGEVDTDDSAYLAVAPRGY